MQPRLLFARTILIFTAVSIISIFASGCGLINSRSESAFPPTVGATATPFDSSPTGMGILSPSASATTALEETPPTATQTSPVAYPGPPEETLPAATALTSEPRRTPSATPTPEQPLLAGKYDDTHPKINYDRHWAYKMNTGTKYAYKGTLHISNSMWSEASFQFTGERFYLGYQRGRNFGIVTVIIDDQTYSFHEQAFDRVWRSPALPPGTHFVRIIHESGESINLDYIEIVGSG